ncbi:4-hydroxyphenylpyruvate dioxygenase [Pseudonocardia sediminis]|uniref:3-dehydroshikimate dehydratase n=1 Tax=Pseudonocardia sediminis TaxID=1397368 RepID=A0A4Q7UWR6_PSEST|nr:sugar phosphate isomerase/epimerase and 4-hydroxyphenylpyruvate domain-containing protein [Pseudonocardia sediminis]RZT86477.1 4-hydroxyphenylpyruvate dioxygenase [Pseudonocardia sediminis]
MSPEPAVLADPAAPFAATRPRTAVATVCLSGTLEDKLAAASTAGFDGVEIFAPDLIASPLSPADIGARCADLGLSVDLYQPLRDIDSTDDARFAANLRRAGATFDVMAGLGADTVLLCSSVSPDAVTDDDRLAGQLHRLAEHAAARGMRIAYEALAWGRHVGTWDHSADVVARADHPALGLCLDSFHILSRGSDPSGIADVPGEKLFFLQLADAPQLTMDVLSWSRHHRLFPGQGEFDLPAFLEPVLAAGYRGPLSLEVFNDVFRQADPVRTAVDARRSLLALAEATARRDTGHHAGTDPVAVAAPELGGHAFVELRGPERPVAEAEAAAAAGAAADPGPDGPDLGTVLRALGFARTGVHRSKPVTRYEQGAARILVNSGAEDDPGADTSHGSGGSTTTAIAALALESADPQSSARRAQRLCAPLLPRRHGPGEADLAEVAAPDGTSLFFCRTDAPDGAGWAGDFVPTGERPGPGTGVTAIDHVGLTQPYDVFDEATLFYRSVLGLAPCADGEFAAPFGLVRSRALADDARRVRLALTVSLLRRGEWAPGVSDPQYIALATDDVVATARAARAAGAPLLEIPANYHDDLDARLEPPPERLAAFRELGVLCEADAQGSYLQVCTELLDGRLFLALVQRVGGHDGFGWSDAPVRMAAHRRRRLARSTGG